VRPARRGVVCTPENYTRAARAIQQATAGTDIAVSELWARRFARAALTAVEMEPSHAVANSSKSPVLTAREFQVLKLAAQGLQDWEIAERMFLSVNTVKTHMRRLYRRMGATGRAHAVALAFGRKILVPGDEIPPDGMGTPAGKE
jgi:DNA-binding CsgD family transcriptional regulator